MSWHPRWLTMIAMLSVAAAENPAGAQGFNVINPLGVRRDDSLVTIPVGKSGDWSIRVGGKVLPAQYDASTGSVRFVMSMGAHETARVHLIPAVAPPAPARVLVTLKVQAGGTLTGSALTGGRFEDRAAYTVPTSHFLHDGLIAFEGIGWESDRVAYRLYLDARNVPDLFGKFGTGMIFPEVGHGFDDYQYPRAWGGDIFKVGDSLGMGGTGLLRGGKASQIGAATVTGKVVANGPVTAIAEVDADAIGGGAASIHATYAISAGSPLTEVKIAAKSLTLPLVAGLTVHPGDRTFVSPSKAGSTWAYVAVWGPQEHGIDKVGTALFYRRDRVTGAPGFDGQTLFIQFLSKAAADYAFAGRWVQENKDVPGYDGTIKDEAAFTAWLEASATELDHPVIVKALP